MTLRFNPKVITTIADPEIYPDRLLQLSAKDSMMLFQPFDGTVRKICRADW